RVLCFFFQAEDGIRDDLVTGVQTCALPISGADELRTDLRNRLDATWRTLRRLLTSAFAEEAPTSREVDLLLAPEPPAEEVRAARSEERRVGKERRAGRGADETRGE